jgi:hypothetical protein
MASLEVAIVIGGVLASFTMCAVKIIHQIQNSKCRFIKCCGNECVRDTELDLPEAEVDAPQPPRMVPLVQSPRPLTRTPSLNVPRPTVKKLQAIYENKPSI